LSASGLAFTSEKAIKPESILELKMILPPSLVAIITYGKVVHCRHHSESENDQFPYNIGVDFLSLDEHDRELLIRHIVKRQMVQLRNRNDSA
jgi:c-di-GMP-binding flagellar brake protein YcgR